MDVFRLDAFTVICIPLIAIIRLFLLTYFPCESIKKVDNSLQLVYRYFRFSSVDWRSLSLSIISWLKMSSDDSDLEENLRNLKLKDKDINILLLGETGVGKSTFINAFANYLSQKYFDNAEKDGLVVLIPSVFTIVDKKGKSREVKVGPEKDKNEVLETGESATQDVKTYVFPISGGNANVRLIDTPGMGDTRGIEQDEKNCDYILRHLKTLKKIHAICFLFKPTEARKTVFFEYCLHQMMSRLDKTACKNIFCLFTNTRGSDYGPGDTFVNLKSFVKHLQAKTTGIDIDIDKNKFCFDNEAFKFLAAVEKKVKFDDSMRGVHLKSWQESAKQCWGFIRQLQKETAPYATDNLLLVNTSRRLMLQLSKVLADIKQLIDDNETVIERLRINKNLDEFDIQELKRKQKSQVTNVERIQVYENLLVCTSRPSCAEVYRVNGMQKWHYKTVCHRPCNETSNDAKDTIGCPQLVNCQVINKLTRCCRQCGCDFSVHMHVNYITRLAENTVWDDEICNRIATRESLLDNSQEIIDDICMKNNELNSEHDTIQKVMFNIARFLQNNAIIASSDSYKEYIVYMINQKQSLGASTNSSVQDLKRFLKEYEETEKVLHQALRSRSPALDLYNDGPSLMKNLKKLLTLTHNGKKIQQIYDEQKKSENEAPPRVKEYVHKFYESEDERKHKARGGVNQNDKKERNSNENFSQKQRDRRGSEKQRDYESNIGNQPRRDLSRGRTDNRRRFNEERNWQSDQRNQHDPRMVPPPYPPGAHGGYTEAPRYATGYDRDPRYHQDPRMAPLPYPQGYPGGYPEPKHYPANDGGPNYNLKVTVDSRPSREAYQYELPPRQAPYRPEPAPFPPRYEGHYPPQFGAYPPQNPHIPPLMQGLYNAPRPGNRRDNQEGRRNNDRGNRGGHRGGRGKDGKQTFKAGYRKPKNKNKKDDSDDDSD